MKNLGAISGSREPSPSYTGLGPSGFDPERKAIALWLRKEASFARHAQGAAAERGEKLYRMGEKDAYLLAADAIERGDYAIAMETRRAETTGSVAKP
jgi:hypothetical protein